MWPSKQAWTMQGTLYLMWVSSFNPQLPPGSPRWGASPLSAVNYLKPQGNPHRPHPEAKGVPLRIPPILSDTALASLAYTGCLQTLTAGEASSVYPQLSPRCLEGEPALSAPLTT